MSAKEADELSIKELGARIKRIKKRAAKEEKRKREEEERIQKEKEKKAYDRFQSSAAGEAVRALMMTKPKNPGPSRPSDEYDKCPRGV